ncbi:TetR/AcrR family transcriptional regulator [Thermus scotoductus]|uniref:TetR family transcriptional regulator n=1 Tax=Thermus scotoductus TaxID=37636 RepID=A0A430RC29_THESC|nr:TetR/AcrR family transcriptional regulator [Thermus scotoductus]RTH04927.1 TetR family transcriptional regulator [Thermus scotoductus]RTH04985.1 TetR family transcriptional regulator [Thermus scotoductus]RTH28436.1 TetR family transcriptional regulator [Thermus scotoductus]RTI42663.1 TetR family transcriptional regulator [Thermus scotoductus]
MGTATRNRILEEAARLFTEKGYEATSVQDLAEALGLSKAALYHHFRSKEEVLYEISLQALEGLCRQGERALSEPDPKVALLRFMEGHARFFEENRPFFVAMLQGLQSLSPEKRAVTIALRDRYEGMLRSILERGMALGVFRPLDVGLTARAILSLLNWMIRWFRPGGPLRAEEVARFYFDLILKGLEKSGGVGEL